MASLRSQVIINSKCVWIDPLVHAYMRMIYTHIYVCIPTGEFPSKAGKTFWRFGRFFFTKTTVTQKISGRMAKNRFSGPKKRPLLHRKFWVFLFLEKNGFLAKKHFTAKRKNGRFSIIPAGTRSIVIVGHFFDGPDGPTKFRWRQSKVLIIAKIAIPKQAGFFGALLAGWLVVVARGLYLARHLFTLFYYPRGYRIITANSNMLT